MVTRAPLAAAGLAGGAGRQDRQHAAGRCPAREHVTARPAAADQGADPGGILAWSDMADPN